MKIWKINERGKKGISMSVFLGDINVSEIPKNQGNINVSEIPKNQGYIKIPILRYLYILYNRL